MLNRRLIKLENEMRKRKPRRTVIIHMTDWAGNPLPLPDLNNIPPDVDILRVRYVENWRENPAVFEDIFPSPEY